VGSIPTRFRHLKGETPLYCGVFAYMSVVISMKKHADFS